MGKIQVTDEFLYQYMSVLEEYVLNNFPKEEEISHEFSKSFLKKMDKLLKRAKQKERYRIPVRTWQRAVAGFVSIVLATFMASLSVEALRDKIFELIRIETPSTVENRYTLIDEQDEFLPYYPEYIPKQFKLVIDDLGEDYLVQSYEDAERNMFLVEQEQIVDGMTITLDNEYIETRPQKILGFQGEFHVKGENEFRAEVMIHNVLFSFAGEGIEEEEFLKMCNSMKSVE